MLGQCFHAVNRQIRVKLLKLATYRGDHLLRVAGRPNNKCKIASVFGAQFCVHERSWLLTQTEIFTILQDTHDLQPWPGYSFETESLSHRGFARPEASRKGLVDQSRARSSVAVLLGKIPTFEQIDSERLNQPWRRKARHRCGNIRAPFLRRAFNIDVVVVEAHA